MKTLLKLLVFFFSFPAFSNHQGFWLGQCQQGKDYSYDFFLEYDEKHFVLKTVGYLDSNCQSPYLTVTKEGTYKKDVSSLRKKMKRVSVTPHTEEMVEQLSLFKDCGFSNWSLHQKKLATGLKCDYLNRGEVFEKEGEVLSLDFSLIHEELVLSSAGKVLRFQRF